MIVESDISDISFSTTAPIGMALPARKDIKKKKRDADRKKTPV